MLSLTMALEEVLSTLETYPNPEKLNLKELVEYIYKLRMLKLSLDEFNTELTKRAVEAFDKGNISEIESKGKLVRPAWQTKYNCKELEKSLPREIREELRKLQALNLNKSIVERAIELQILNGKSIESYIKAGLVEKKTKYYIKFSDPDKESEVERLGRELGEKVCTLSKRSHSNKTE